MAYVERYVRSDAAGLGTADGTTDSTNALTGAWSWAEMLTNLVAGQRANVKSGTYNNGTTTTVFTNAGTITNPMALRGFVTSIGDLETQARTPGQTLNTTSFPSVINTGTSAINTFPAYMNVSCIKFQSGASDGTIKDGTNNTFFKVYAANIGNGGASAIGIKLGDNYSLCVDCDAYCDSTSSTAAFASSRATLVNCLGYGPNNAGCIAFSASTFVVFVGCMARDCSVGFKSNTALLTSMVNCSVQNFGTTAFQNGGAPVHMVNCVAYAPSNTPNIYTSATSIRAMGRFVNFIGGTSAGDTNPGNYPIVNEVALTVNPFASSGDMSLNSTAGGGAACKGVGLWPYMDGGAVQVQAGAGTTAGTPAFASM